MMERKDFIKEMDDIIEILHERGVDKYRSRVLEYLEKIENEKSKETIKEFKQEIRISAGKIKRIKEKQQTGDLKSNEAETSTNQLMRAIDTRHEQLKEDLLYFLDDFFEEDKGTVHNTTLYDGVENGLQGILERFEEKILEQVNILNCPFIETGSPVGVYHNATKNMMGNNSGKETARFEQSKDSISWEGDYMSIPYIELAGGFEERWLKLYQKEGDPFHIFMNKEKFDKKSFATTIKKKMKTDEVNSNREIRLIIYGFQKSDKMNYPKKIMDKIQELRSDKGTFNRMVKAIRMSIFNDAELASLRGNGQLTIISYFVPM